MLAQLCKSRTENGTHMLNSLLLPSTKRPFLGNTHFMLTLSCAISERAQWRYLCMRSSESMTPMLVPRPHRNTLMLHGGLQLVLAWRRMLHCKQPSPHIAMLALLPSQPNAT